MPHVRDIRKGNPARKNAPKPYQGYYLDAEGRRHTKLFKLKSDAVRWSNERQLLVDRGDRPHDGKQPYGPYGSAWLARRVVAASTAEVDRGRFANHILPAWGTTHLDAIRVSGVQDWVKQLEQKLAPETVHKVFQLFGASMDAAFKDGYIPKNPCRLGIMLPRCPPGREEHLSREEVDAIADAMRALRPGPAGEFDALVLETFVSTGLRFGEIIGLEVRQLDLTASPARINVDRAIVHGEVRPTKTSNRRHVWIPDHLADMLIKHLVDHPPVTDELGTLVFRPNSVDPRWGRTLSTVHWPRTAWRPAVAAVFGCRKHKSKRIWYHDGCGCRGIVPHDLRHTFASWLAQAGVPLVVIQKLLGHSTIVTTQRYAHLQPDAGAVAVAAMHRIRAGV